MKDAYGNVAEVKLALQFVKQEAFKTSAAKDLTPLTPEMAGTITSKNVKIDFAAGSFMIWHLWGFTSKNLHC